MKVKGKMDERERGVLSRETGKGENREGTGKSTTFSTEIQKKVNVLYVY